MTLHYAHLAPDQRRDAVAELNEQPTYAAAARLSWVAEPSEIFYTIGLISRKGGTGNVEICMKP